jgi:hypothetical protein
MNRDATLAETERSLGQRLAPLLGGGFFRPLSRRSAAIYIDCADCLVEAADEGGQLLHEDARSLIREILLRHPDIQLDEDEGGQLRDLGQRAAQFFNKLLEAHWLEPRRVSLDENYVLIAPALRHLLSALREMAKDRPADLKDFAATLRSLCRDLLGECALDPNRLDAEAMRQTVKDLLDRAARASDQMHAVESLILQHDAAQRASDSAQETLQRFLVDFHAGQHMVCYDALQEAGLLPNLNQARSVAQDALHDPFVKQRLAEGLARHLSLEATATAAYSEAEKWLARLERQLASIPNKQRIIDRRMADFSTLSNARYRYQTEMRSRRPEQVKAYLDDAAKAHVGQTFAGLTREPGMTLLSSSTEIFFGLDSLSTPRRARPPVDLSFEADRAERDPEAAREEIRRRNLYVLTPQRAARFVERHLPAIGARISTEHLRILRDDELLDLLAVLSFDRGPSAASGKHVRWRIHPVRADFGTEPEHIPHDVEADRKTERFALERLA